MILERFEVPGLAHYSYVLGSKGKAVVIDPKRDVDTYLDFARRKQLEITHVLETHIHADYASGAGALAQTAGAELWLSGHDEGQTYEYRFPHHEMRDGDDLYLGDLRIVAIHTPGHTPEHLSFLVYETTRCGQPMSLFSGDFIFVGSLGRPDLLGEAAKVQLAEALYDAVHRKIARLPDGVEILPAHGAGSMCGTAIGQRARSTLGYERFCNVFMAGRERREFVQTILSTVPEFPEYYRRMKELNAQGPPIFDQLPGGALLSPAEFGDNMRRSNAVVIDLRSPEAFGGAHIPGAFNIGAGPNLSVWAAWVVPYDCPILLTGDENTDLEQARRSLLRVGLDSIAGSLKGGMRAWIEAGFEQAHVRQESVHELAEQLPEQPFVLDVRSSGEWKAGHIAGALHIPGGSLPNRIGEVPRDRAVHVICGSGYRSSIATSVLTQAGLRDIVNVAGGMAAWQAQQLPSHRESAAGA
jgi:hydroxyacylglutathione hydrolase